jgi:hypothetical protein
MELKSGGLDVDDVVIQIQNGAAIIEDLLDGMPCVFLPVLVHMSLKSIQVDRLRRRKIKFRNNSFGVALVKNSADVVALPW